MAESVLATALGLRGSNPKKLDLININAGQVQQRTIEDNLRNAPGAFQLADLANTFSTEELLKSLEQMLPGFANMRDQITGVLGSKLRGEVPRDVQTLLERNAAEKGVALGTSGSQLNQFDELRNLGLTSLGIQNEGVAQASSWIRSLPQAPKLDFTSMFFTPQQRLNFEFQQAQANKPIEWLNHQIDALPSNIERAAAGLLDWVATTGTSVLSMYTGGALAGGGSGGGGMMGMMGGGSGGGGTASSTPGAGLGYNPVPFEGAGGNTEGASQFNNWWNRQGGF